MKKDVIKGSESRVPAQTAPASGMLHSFFSMIEKGFQFIRSKWSVRYWVKKTDGENSVEREWTIKKNC